MAGKAGMGRLVFGGRQEYQATPYYQGGIYYGHAAICKCDLGNHFLSPSGEHTANDGTPIYVYPTYAEAQAAIEQWQRQHAAAVANSGETPQEG